jgi:hypothetical protein
MILAVRVDNFSNDPSLQNRKGNVLKIEVS